MSPILGLGIGLAIAGMAVSSAKEPAHPLVAIRTSYGPIVVELFTDKAPLTSQNFLRYVDRGLYENATFYRAARADNDERTPKIRVIQGGIDPTCRHAPLPPVAHETTTATGLRHIDGALSAVRWEPGTAASEFFIVLGDTPELDFGGSRQPDKQGFAVFGRVVQGMDIVRRINAARTGTSPDEAMSLYKGQALVESVRFHVDRIP